jgi:hypothetical protein
MDGYPKRCEEVRRRAASCCTIGSMPSERISNPVGREGTTA